MSAGSGPRPSTVADGRLLPGELMIIAAILAVPVVDKDLTRLGVQAGAPPRALTQERQSRMSSA